MKILSETEMNNLANVVGEKKVELFVFLLVDG